MQVLHHQYSFLPRRIQFERHLDQRGVKFGSYELLSLKFDESGRYYHILNGVISGKDTWCVPYRFGGDGGSETLFQV
jgi:hypothetical protein